MSNYRIQSGDTLSQLAQQFGTSVQKLANANGIKNVDLIYAGANLRVPGGPGGADTFQPGGSRSRAGGPSTSGVDAPSADGVGGSKAAHLAEVARRTASNMNTTGWCAKGVNDALDAAGLSVQRVPSAYMAANVLAGDSRFREVSLRPGQPPPPGAIIVHPSMYNGSQVHGHIAVSLGNGMEASDHVQSLITDPRQRVFIPIG